MRIIKKVSINSLSEIKPRILNWAQQFEEVAWLDSNNFKDNHSTFKAVLAVDNPNLLLM
ncbi:MAG: aminodeoxychorismate synthase component I, partial [Flavobacteriaceae bacterium]|nr:aminodeoxychorismate synthase component I [Flavobacteriaceae bacterium]